MITTRVKFQLLIFALITMVGVSFVGARYAQLDRYFVDKTYPVEVQLAESGGIFVGSEVTYRGVGVGRVTDLELRRGGGVDATLEIENEYDQIPSDTFALVGNRSAVGEQYVELQPRRKSGPYLSAGSTIPTRDTGTPIATEKLLADISRTVSSVDRQALRTVVREMGTAFNGAGPDLERIIDTSTSFIEEADANFEVTQNLIRDSNTVLRTQLDSASAFHTFARDMGRFTQTMAGSDQDLRTVIDRSAATSVQIRTFLEENEEQFAKLLNNLVTTGEIVSAHLPGIEQVLVLYPYAVEGGMTVVSKSPDTGLNNAHFGMVMSDTHPCFGGYEDTEVRSPHNGTDIPMNEDAECTEEGSVPRGAHNSPDQRGYNRPAPTYDGPVVGTYDPQTQTFEAGPVPDDAHQPPSTVTGGAGTGAGNDEAAREEAWQWLYLQPRATAQE